MKVDGNPNWSRSFPGGTSGKEPAYQCRRHKGCVFDPWVGKIPWRKARQPTLVFLPGESPWTEEPGRVQSIGSQSWTRLKWLSTHTEAEVYIRVYRRNKFKRCLAKRRPKLDCWLEGRWERNIFYISQFFFFTWVTKLIVVWGIHDWFVLNMKTQRSSWNM